MLANFGRRVKNADRWAPVAEGSLLQLATGRNQRTTAAQIEPEGEEGPMALSNAKKAQYCPISTSTVSFTVVSMFVMHASEQPLLPR